MALIIKALLTVVFFFSFIFASWYQVHGDIVFSADIGRDFHLFQEVADKGLVLIGPRSSTGLFHGPAWTYLNFPAFIIGGGNPLVVGWFWVALASVWVASNYFIAKDLLGKTPGLFFAAITAVYIGYHTNGLFNPHGAMFLVPLFFYLFIKYLRTKKWKYLALHIIVGGAILQFQLALGVPFLGLSTIFLIYYVIKSKKPKHLLFFLLIPLLVSNFVLFDLRHDGIYRDKLFSFVQPEEKGEIYNYAQLIDNRVSMAFNSAEILRHDAYGYLNLIFFGAVILLCIYFSRKGVYKDIYLSFLYFYFGFFILSFINKGPILYFYVFPIFPLVFFIMSSFANTKLKNYLIIPLAMILLINMSNAVRDMKDAQANKIGQTMHSWKFLKEAGELAFKADEDFGYFVYSPDSFAYESRYAMMYLSKVYGKGSYYKKEPVTIILAAPTPKNEFITGDAWWTENKVGIKSDPVQAVDFSNGYKLERYILSDEEIDVPPAPDIDTGIHFR